MFAIVLIVAPGAPAHAQEGSDGAVIDDPGPGWSEMPSTDVPQLGLPGTTTRAWQRDDGVLEITSYPNDLCAFIGVDSRTQALTGAWAIGLTYLAEEAGVEYFGGGQPLTRMAVFSGSHHTFSITMFSFSESAEQLDTELRTIVEQQVADELPLATPSKRQHSRLDNLVLSTSLEDPTLTALPIDLDTFGCEEPTTPVLAFLERNTVERSRLFNAAQSIVVISLAEYPYETFAAASIGVRFSPELATPIDVAGLERIPDATAWAFRETPGQVLIRFRRGDIVVDSTASASSQADAGALALDYAIAQSDRLPAGATSALVFPSTTESLVTATGMIGFLGIATIAVRLFRGRRPRARERSIQTAASVVRVVDVDPVSARLRRLGRWVATLQVTSITLVLVVIAADVGAWRWVVGAGGIVVGFAVTLVGRRLEWALVHTDRLRRRYHSSVSAAVASSCAVVIVIVGGATLILGLREIVLAPSLSHLQRADQLGIDPALLSWVLLAAGVVALVVGTLVFRLSRALTRVGWRQADSEQAPVLYLRSFEDDRLTVPAVLSARRPFVEFFTLRGREPFEESVAWELANIGPVIAIGRPGISRATLGAAREHFGDEWRERIEERMAAAALIVVTVGATPGLAWELSHVTQHGHLDKVRFVIPPVSAQDAAARWTFTSASLGIHDEQAIPDTLPIDTRVVRLGSDNVSAFVGSAGDEADYRASIALAATTL